MHLIKILILSLLTLSHVNLLTANNLNYERIWKGVRSLSHKEIIELGDKFIHRNNIDSAIILYSYVANCYSQDNDDTSNYYCALSCLKAGDAYSMEDLYTNALSMYIEGLKIYEKCHDKSLLMRFYKNIGNLYCFFEDYGRGISFYEKGYSFHNDYKDRKEEWSLLSNLTCTYCFTDQLDKAKEKYMQMTRVMNPNDSIEAFMKIYCQGLIYQLQRAYPQAIQCQHEAEQIISSPVYDCYAYEKLYKIYNDINMPDSSIFYLEKCHELSKQNNMQRMYVQTLKDLACYYQNVDPNKSIRYFADYSNLTDSIYNHRQFNRIRNEQLLYEVEKTNHGILKLKLEQDVMQQKLIKQQIVIFASSVIILISVIFIVIVWIQKKRIQHSYANLFDINQNMLAAEKANEELNNSFRKQIDGLLSELQRYKQVEQVEDCESQTVKNGKTGLKEEQALILARNIMQVMEDKEYCNPDFSQEKLATLVNSNYKYVSVVINKYYQKSFNQFLNDFRIKEAQIRLVDKKYSHMTIQAIGESVGYKSSATFIRSFRNTTGLTPSLYQKIAREKDKKDFNS